MGTTVALSGNPNSGKTTLFNALTGAHQHVGNYPGVTVEKKQGVYARNGYRFNIIDLPGTYSLTAYSLEEVVTRDFLANEKPDVVIDIVDASNLERNLYLAVQFMEMGVRLCVALNMMDVAGGRGIQVDAERLEALLGVPVVPTVARKGSGKEKLMDAADDIIRNNRTQKPLDISYGKDIDQAMAEMEAIIESRAFLTDTHRARWVALKYLENDEQVRSLGKEKDPDLANELEKVVQRVSDHLQETLDTYPEVMIADYRYGFIKSIIRQGVVSYRTDQNRLYVSDKIDKILTHRFIGPLVMIAVILGLYHLTFTYSEAPVGWMEAFFGWLGESVESLLPDGPVKSLIVSGVIDGVGGVLGFVPLIMFMFFGIALLEDSGYMARVAFMLDRVFQIFGLHGSSVIAFIVSGGIAGGCAVPGVMATRTLKSTRERLATLLTVPFMNCGAKLPVFALLVAAFFAENKALVMFFITIISWTGALLVAKFLRVTVVKGAPTPFIMELPPYRVPTFKGLAIHTLERTRQYIKKAGTVILGISIVLWAMMTFPGLPESQRERFEQERQAAEAQFPGTVMKEAGFLKGEGRLSAEARAFKEKQTAIHAEEAEAALRYSVAGRIGSSLETVTRFAGFDWRTNIALVGGFAAKEIVVSTLGTAYSLGDVDPEESDSLSKKLSGSSHWRPLIAASLILFTIFYAPCFVTVVCISKESSWRWGAFSMLFNTALAFAISAAVFQVGTALGF
ncbi:MAG: ferrous iron transport protein B [Desulfobacteraceae bacterium]|nr:MAG: ferrous iron transport protein B [Desulfobacteraceae bacterium]